MASSLMGGSAKLEMYDFCIPAQVVLSMLCAHQFLLAGDMGPVLKWVQATQNLLSFVEHCMDEHAPFPLLVDDLKKWVQRWITQPVPAFSQEHLTSFLTATAFS